MISVLKFTQTTFKEQLDTRLKISVLLSSVVECCHTRHLRWVGWGLVSLLHRLPNSDVARSWRTPFHHWDKRERINHWRSAKTCFSVGVKLLKPRWHTDSWTVCNFTMFHNQNILNKTVSTVGLNWLFSWPLSLWIISFNKMSENWEKIQFLTSSDLFYLIRPKILILNYRKLGKAANRHIWWAKTGKYLAACWYMIKTLNQINQEAAGFGLCGGDQSPSIHPSIICTHYMYAA